MSTNQHIIDEILHCLADNKDILTKEHFHKEKNHILSKFREKDGPSHIAMIERYNELVKEGKIPDDIRIRIVLRKRAVRSLSGVAVISLLTKFWGCPGKCVYCPTYDNLPKSYISDEPAVQRAEMNEFDPFRQVQNRLESLSMTGNAISKCDVRVIGGTWSVYPREYQENFLREIYDAHTSFGEEGNGGQRKNGETEGDTLFEAEEKQYKGGAKANEFVSPSEPFGTFHNGKVQKENIEKEDFEVTEMLTAGREGQSSGDDSNDRKAEKRSPFTSASSPKNPHFISSKTLEEAKLRNETALSRVIGVAIETRPDWIDEEEIIRLRRYGVTRVEIGYQTTDDEINTLNKRGHGNIESIRATKLLKDAGFKVVAHMMPGLVGATPEGDKISMNEIFANPDFRPDELKIYPMVVTPNSELTDMWKRGEFVPYDDMTLIPLMAEIQGMLPEYVRLNRMYRDIPASEILAGSKLANLRQVTEVAMRARGITRHDISAREIRAKGNSPEGAVFEEFFYEASGGHEWFFQMIDPADRTIFGLLRLRIPSQIFTGERHFIPELQDAAIIREVHVFGEQLPITTHHPTIQPSSHPTTSGQHMGFGKFMMEKAYEKIQLYYPQCTKIAVISGVGARPYYEKRGYTKHSEYMVQSIDR